MSVEDAAMTREVMRDIGRRPVDVGRLDVHVMHGVVYLNGYMTKMHGYNDDVDLKEELHTIVKLIRYKPGVRDVVCEVQLTEPPARHAVHHARHG